MLEFTWEAFVLALVNFVVLMVLLYWLLHKPLLQMLEKRRRDLEGARQEAEKAAEDALAEKEEYENKLASIREERNLLLSEARKEGQAAREEIVKKAREEAQRAVANIERDGERQRREALQSLEQELVDISMGLTRRILEKLAGADMETRLLALLDSELEGLSSRLEENERKDLFAGEVKVRVVSAKPIERQQQEGIQKRIKALSERPVEVAFETDAELIAGARAEFSSMAIDASLAGVLETVREGCRKVPAAGTEEGESK